MSKITKQEILELTPRQIKAHCDLHPEDGLKIWRVLIVVYIKIRMANFIKRLKGENHHENKDGI